MWPVKGERRQISIVQSKCKRKQDESERQRQSERERSECKESVSARSSLFILSTRSHVCLSLSRVSIKLNRKKCSLLCARSAPRWKWVHFLWVEHSTDFWYYCGTCQSVNCQWRLESGTLRLTGPTDRVAVIVAYQAVAYYRWKRPMQLVCSHLNTLAVPSEKYAG